MCKFTTSRNEPRQFNDGCIRRWRKRRGLSRRQAANVLDLPYSTYCRYEAGSEPPLSTANRICALTRGAIRYRDLWPHFDPSFA